MTRINTIDPSLLSDEHLNGEYTELPRAFNLTKKAIKRGRKPTDKHYQGNYTMGDGHVKFFYNKLEYLVKRQEAIIAEKDKRGFISNFREPRNLLEGIPNEWINDWQPELGDLAVNLVRLRERDIEFYGDFDLVHCLEVVRGRK